MCRSLKRCCKWLANFSWIRKKCKIMRIIFFWRCIRNFCGKSIENRSFWCAQPVFPSATDLLTNSVTKLETTCEWGISYRNVRLEDDQNLVAGRIQRRRQSCAAKSSQRKQNYTRLRRNEWRKCIWYVIVWQPLRAIGPVFGRQRGRVQSITTRGRGRIHQLSI